MQKTTSIHRESFHLTSLEQRARGATWPKVNFLFLLFYYDFRSLALSLSSPPTPLLTQLCITLFQQLAQGGFLQTHCYPAQKLFRTAHTDSQLEKLSGGYCLNCSCLIKHSCSGGMRKRPYTCPNFNRKFIPRRDGYTLQNSGFGAACAITSCAIYPILIIRSPPPLLGRPPPLATPSCALRGQTNWAENFC